MESIKRSLGEDGELASGTFLSKSRVRGDLHSTVFGSLLDDVIVPLKSVRTTRDIYNHKDLNVDSGSASTNVTSNYAPRWIMIISMLCTEEEMWSKRLTR